MKKALAVFIWYALSSLPALAQSASQEAKISKKLESYFVKYKPKGQVMLRTARMLDCVFDNNRQTITITANDVFAEQEFTPENTAAIYKKIRNELPKPYNKYAVTVITNGLPIEDLIPSRLSDSPDKSRLWGNIDYDGQPWVQNSSCPYKITHGLQGRHLSLWASHGMYYDQSKTEWRWQRPKLFCTTEDLYTQTIVIPYLIPMLENAGAIVFTPRERDWQKNEVIVDNDHTFAGRYAEINTHGHWQRTDEPGFALHQGTYSDGENPFTAGTARKAKTINSKYKYSFAAYQPQIPQAGRYAVYVSYQTLKNSIDDAHYIVWHKGEKTEFLVNQQMGGGTWVYLGTFDFDAGCNEYNRVILTNQSSSKGVVTTDAVRFGGGMGNIQREGTVSGMPRALEGARYYAQWAGMPYSVYSSKEGTDDYSDDINARSLMTNLLGGGSPYMPNAEGRKVPIELSLAIHSDAGYAKDGEGLIGALSICTTQFNDGKLNAGISRLASRDLADALLSNEVHDLSYKYGRWNKREIYDRNYSETRLPYVPSAILETMSHQNFPDMRYGQDPNFRFTLARSIYKTLLRYVNDLHGRPFIVAPLTPEHFRLQLTDKNEVKLSWTPVDDPQEATSKATGYVVYTAVDNGGFDNGTYIKGQTSCKMQLLPGTLYHFKVRAVNRGGCSFPTEVLSALCQPGATKTVLIVNGFHRLSSPAVRNTAAEQGFDLDEDPGVTYGPTAGWSGRQLDFDRTAIGRTEAGGLGWSGNELAGTFVAGNDFNYVQTHARAIASAHQYNIVSCSSTAVESNAVSLAPYAVTDLLLGLERNDGHSLVYYKTFSTTMQNLLRQYTAQGGSLLVSGAYVGSDMTSNAEQQFLADVLKCRFIGSNRLADDCVNGLGSTFTYHHTLNEAHYAAVSTDILRPLSPAYPAMQYADQSDAAIAYDGQDYRTFTMGLPFECIRDEQQRCSLMQGIMQFLTR